LARRAAAKAPPEKADFAEKAARFGTWAAGALVLLALLGIQPAAILASLGFVSVGLAFAMKDLADNLVAGLMVAAYRPFALGDAVKFGEAKAPDALEGAVVDITHRYVTLRLEGGSYRTVQVPNSKLMREKIYVGRRPLPAEPKEPTPDEVYAAGREALLAVPGVRGAALKTDKVLGPTILVWLELGPGRPSPEAVKQAALKAVPALEKAPVRWILRAGL
jgi:hypothetical protein